MIARNFLTLIKNNREYQITLLLLLFYISEGLTKYFIFTQAIFHNYSAIIKSFFVLFSIVYSLYYLNDRSRKILYWFTTFIIIFFIGHFVYNNYTFNDHILINFKFAIRYLFIFIIVLYFGNEVFNKKDTLFSVVFEKVVIFNSLLILIGFLFDIYIFKTYKGERFGFSGLFAIPSLTTYFYALALTYFTHQVIDTKKKKWELALVIITSLFVGTKAILLFLILTGIHIFIRLKFYKNKSILLIGLTMIGISFYLRDIIYNFIIVRYNVLYNFYKEYGFFAMLTSGRNLKFVDNFIPLINEKWTIVNYLFGGTDFVDYRVEFELFDLLLFWGFLGSAIYLFYYFKVVVKFNQLNKFAKIQMLFLLTIIMFSGNFFHNASIALYLLIILGNTRKQ